VPQLAGKELAEGVVTVRHSPRCRAPRRRTSTRKMLRDYGEDPFRSRPPRRTTRRACCSWALSKSARLRQAARRDESLDGFKGVTAAPSKPFGTDRHHSLEGKDMFPAV